MPLPHMNLKILLPFRVFAEKTGVLRIVAETREGSFGLLPHRLDCVLALVPGILAYETESEGQVYVAVGNGVLVKAGAEILVSVRLALAGPNLAQMRDSLEQEFADRNEHEQSMHAVMAKLEAGFMHRLVGLQHE